MQIMVAMQKYIFRIKPPQCHLWIVKITVIIIQGEYDSSMHASGVETGMEPVSDLKGAAEAHVF